MNSSVGDVDFKFCTVRTSARPCGRVVRPCRMLHDCASTLSLCMIEYGVTTFRRIWILYNCCKVHRCSEIMHILVPFGFFLAVNKKDGHEREKRRNIEMMERE